MSCKRTALIMGGFFIRRLDPDSGGEWIAVTCYISHFGGKDSVETSTNTCEALGLGVKDWAVVLHLLTNLYAYDSGACQKLF
jgi:hypothetical protein